MNDHKKLNLDVDLPPSGSFDMKKVLSAMFLAPMSRLFGQKENDAVFGLPVLLHGPPGASKTSLVKWLAHRYGLSANFINFKPGARGEGGTGVIPVKGEYNGRVCFDYPPSREVLERLAGGVGLVLVDDIRSAPPAIQPALLDIIQERMVGTYPFGGRVRVIGATNSLDDSAGGYEFAPSIANRLAHLPFADPSPADFDEYLSSMKFGSGDAFEDEEVIDLAAAEAHVLAELPAHWAYTVGLVSQFLRAHPHLRRTQPPANSPRAAGPWASPRSIAELATVALATAKIFKLGENEAQAMVGACVGWSWAVAFAAWTRNLDVPSPEVHLRQIEEGKPTFVHDVMRFDRTSVLVSSCTTYVLGCTTPTERQRWAAPFWRFLGTLVGDAPDIVRPVCGKLHRARLASSPEAIKVLSQMASYSTAARAAGVESV